MTHIPCHVMSWPNLISSTSRVSLLAVFVGFALPIFVFLSSYSSYSIKKSSYLHSDYLTVSISYKNQNLFECIDIKLMFFKVYICIYIFFSRISYTGKQSLVVGTRIIEVLVFPRVDGYFAELRPFITANEVFQRRKRGRWLFLLPLLDSGIPLCLYFLES